MTRTTPTLLLLLACLLTLPGCAAAVPIVSAGAAAGEAGYSFWQSGKLTYVDEGTTREMNRAMVLTFNRLALTVDETKDRLDDDGNLKSRWWSIHSDRGHLLTIETRPLTSTMVEVKIDAGAFGNKAAAELIADRLKAELDEIQAAGADAVAD
ncbi:MAG: DUF3568 family protein [bacterium]|nr:DUF3568 family protein [bacterium]